MTDKILIVDDDVNILEGYKRFLRRQYQIVTTLGGQSGLEKVHTNGPFAVVVSDLRMPGMDGVEFLARIREQTPDSVRILLTGQADLNNAIEAVNKGHIFRFLTKPCPPTIFRQALDAGLEQYRLISSERELLGKTLKGSIKLLVDILSIVSPDAFSRSNRTRNLAHNIANRLNVTNLWEVDLAASLSQIGCAALPPEILHKINKGQMLSAQENVIFLNHPKIGRDLLINIPRLQSIAEAIAYQEKQFDGGGPPINEITKGKAIPLIARILKVVNDYDAAVAAGQTPLQAFKKMRSHSSWYDPDVLAALVAENLKMEDGLIVKEIKKENIEVGMIVADDIKFKSGKILVHKRQEITEFMKMRMIQ
ncbi:MAG: HD domain-containing phosphohydrolase, partial [bacterium]